MSGISAADRGGYPYLKSGRAGHNANPAQERGLISIDCQSQQYISVIQTAIRGCILIVDDNNLVREILAELLNCEGYRVRQASDAAEALMILNNDPSIDVMVTDLTMPGGDGITLIRQARECRPDLPAILLTGYAEQVTSLSATAIGDFNVLSKPVEIDILINRLEYLMKPVSA